MRAMDFAMGAVVGALITMSAVRMIAGWPGARARMQTEMAAKAIVIEGNIFRCLVPGCPHPDVPHIHQNQLNAMQSEAHGTDGVRFYPPVWPDPATP